MRKAIFIFLFSITAASANELCYDRAVLTIQQAKTDLLNCKPDLDLSVFDSLSMGLQSRTPVPGVYSQRIINRLTRIYRLYRSDLPYGEQTRNNECIQEALKKFDRLRLIILDAMVYCS